MAVANKWNTVQRFIAAGAISTVEKSNGLIASARTTTVLLTMNVPVYSVEDGLGGEPSSVYQMKGLGKGAVNVSSTQAALVKLKLAGDWFDTESVNLSTESTRSRAGALVTEPHGLLTTTL